MIDFKNGFFKLKAIPTEQVDNSIISLLVEGEFVMSAFKATRDKVIFTNKRIIAINVQGLTGSKVAYTSLPYSKVQSFAIETAGTFDRDCELELSISSIGNIKFEFKDSFDIKTFSKFLANYIL